MTAPDLDALERKAMAATPGPWDIYSNGRSSLLHIDTAIDSPVGGVAICSVNKKGEANAAYIAAANPAAILSLIAEVRGQAGKIAAAKLAGERAGCASFADDPAKVIEDLTRILVKLVDKQQKTEARAVEAERQRDEARAALEALQRWAGQRCPCDNDEPRICPLCLADATKDACMAVPSTFPRHLREMMDRTLSALPPPAGSETGER